LVTGAARRVGRAIALELARCGCDVAVHYHGSAAQARQVAAEITALGRRAAALSADLASPPQVAGLVEQVRQALGRLDILINNASVFPQTQGAAWQDAEHWQTTLMVNAVAPAMLAQAAAPLMRAGGGRIVNLADILAERPIRGHAAYCASKAALVAITRSLARELAPEITVNAVAPGIAIFPEHYSQELRAELTQRVPLRRAGSPEQIARVVRFLALEAEYITGQVIAVDGGRSVVP
jgi:pteridine reductase